MWVIACEFILFCGKRTDAMEILCLFTVYAFQITYKKFTFVICCNEVVLFSFVFLMLLLVQDCMLCIRVNKVICLHSALKSYYLLR